MAVAVVNVGPMGVAVRKRLMLVPVAVRRPFSTVGMVVEMMGVIMSVRVGMVQVAMGMGMGMPVPE